MKNPPRLELTTQGAYVTRPWYHGAVLGLLLFAAMLGCGLEADRTHTVTVWRQDQVDRVVDLIDRRLALMESVARWKWEHQRPIEDLDREAHLIESLTAKARERGLDPKFVQAFFEAQIEAAKQAQRFWFQRWQSRPPAPNAPVPDLIDEIRPELSALSEELLDALAETVAFTLDPDWQAAVHRRADEMLDREYLSDPTRRKVIDSLWKRHSRDKS